MPNEIESNKMGACSCQQKFVPKNKDDVKSAIVRCIDTTNLNRLKQVMSSIKPSKTYDAP